MGNLRERLHKLFSVLIQSFMWITIGFEFVSLVVKILKSIQNLTLFDTHEIIIKVLNILIIYELFTTLLTAFEENRIKLNLIIDTAMIFSIRELLIIIFTYKKLELDVGLSYALILGVLGILRFLYMKYKLEGT
ncbi:phosphate-starvation-inducible PsiE family protein [Aquifex pyrophilus]